MKLNARELQRLASTCSVHLADQEEGGPLWENFRDYVVDLTEWVEKNIEGPFDRQQFLDDAGCYDLDDDSPGSNDKFLRL